MLLISWWCILIEVINRPHLLQPASLRTPSIRLLRHQRNPQNCTSLLMKLLRHRLVTEPVSMMLRPADKCYPVLIELCSLVPVLLMNMIWMQKWWRLGELSMITEIKPWLNYFSAKWDETGIQQLCMVCAWNCGHAWVSVADLLFSLCLWAKHRKILYLWPWVILDQELSFSGHLTSLLIAATISFISCGPFLVAHLVMQLLHWSMSLSLADLTSDT